MYENEFTIIVQDYEKELGVFDCCIGHLHFGSPNPNRQHVYIVYENQALYKTQFVAIRHYLEDVLWLKDVLIYLRKSYKTAEIANLTETSQSTVQRLKREFQIG